MLRFDTRKVKPKLYIELVLLIVTIAAVVLVMLIVGKEGAKIAALILSVFFLVSVAVFLDAFRKQVQYNPYSYNTIFYFGFALFILSIAIAVIIQTIRIFIHPEMYGLITIATTLMNSARNYMIISSPFILAFSVALFVSNIFLLKNEGRRVQNFLGMLLAILMIAGEVLMFVFNNYVSGSQTEVMIHEAFWNLVAAIYLYFECMIIGTMVADAMTAKYKPDRDQDYIIILGCRVADDGSPLPLLKGRIDRALRHYRQQIEETGKRAIFVPSGGKGSDEPISESQCMKNYLVENGVPEEDILMEDASENTYENMKNSRELIQAHWDVSKGEPKVAFSTTNYHVFRSGLLSRRIKFRTTGMGARTKWYFWPNAAVREFVGLLTGHKVKQALILLCIIAFFVITPIVMYSNFL